MASLCGLLHRYDRRKRDARKGNPHDDLCGKPIAGVLLRHCNTGSRASGRSHRGGGHGCSRPSSRYAHPLELPLLLLPGLKARSRFPWRARARLQSGRGCAPRITGAFALPIRSSREDMEKRFVVIYLSFRLIFEPQTGHSPSVLNTGRSRCTGISRRSFLPARCRRGCTAIPRPAGHVLDRKIVRKDGRPELLRQGRGHHSRYRRSPEGPRSSLRPPLPVRVLSTRKRTRSPAATSRS